MSTPTPPSFRPVARPRAWLGSEQTHRDDWILRLSAAEVDELAAAGERARAGGRPLDDLTQGDFPLPKLAPRLERMKQDLATGRGFALLRGIPGEGYGVEALAAMIWGIGAHLGVGVSQSAEGDRIGHVMDRGLPTERYYTRGGSLEFHMDPVDVVGLVCVRRSASGGASRIVSAFAVHNAIMAERPDLLAVLYRGFRCSRAGHGESIAPAPVPVFAEGGQGLECYYLPITVRRAEMEGVVITDEERQAMAFLEAVANRPGLYLDMDFQEGDIQFLNNRAILHARTDYVDDADPAKKRHLLRLWLMMPDWPRRPRAQDFYETEDRAGGGVRPQAATASAI